MYKILFYHLLQNSLTLYIYIYRDYSIINDRIIFCIYSVLLTRQVCIALYDYTILLVREL
jgi:hypothetical protein